MLLPRGSHCVTHIVGTNISLLAGGDNMATPTPTAYSDVWVYNWVASNWTQWPSMPAAATSLVCGVLLDQNTGNAANVIVIGNSIFTV